MDNVGWAGLGIIPIFDGFQGKLEQGSAKHLAAAGVTGGEKFGDAAGKSAGRRFGARLKTAAKIGAGILAIATAGAVKFTNDALAEARESQKVGALTTSTIKATGKAAKVTAKHVGNLSGAISEQAGIDDEVIQRGANMILTFKNIRNEQGKNNKIFDDATKVTADMAAAMAGGSGEVDLKSSAILVGKALNDPAKGLTALTRVGVTFTEGQKKQIETLLKHGDTMKAQKVILGELQSEFGGAAAAQATAGEKLEVAWGNFKEGVGTALLPVLDDLQTFMLKKGIPAMQKFSDWFSEDGLPGIKKFTREAKPFVEDVLTKTRDILREATPYAKKFVDAFGKIPPGVLKTAAAVGVLGFAGSKIPGAKAGLGLGAKGVGGLLGLATKKSPLPVIVMNPGFKVGPDGTPVVTGTPDGASRGRGTKVGRALRGIGRSLGPALLLDAGYEVLADDFYGTLPKPTPPKPGDPNPAKFSAFGAGAMTGTAEIKKATEAVIVQNDAWGKVRNKLEQGNTAAQNLYSQVFDLRGEVDKVAGRKVTRFEAPNLLNLLDQVQRYGSWLDGLDGRTVKTFFSNRLDHNEGQLERFGGFRASGGDVRAGRSYVVGENGPEVLNVGQSGSITPNHALGGKREYHFHGIQNLDALRREVQHAERAEAIGAVDFR